MADAADVMAVAQRQQAGACRQRTLDRHGDGLVGHRLAETEPAVEQQQPAGVGDQRRAGVEVQLAGARVGDVGGDHADAMGIMAAQIGLDEMIGDEVAFARRRTGRCKQGPDGRSQPLLVDPDLGHHQHVPRRGPMPR